MEEIFKKLKLLDEHFRKGDKPEKMRFLERVVKLNEEVGELCEAVLVEVDENQRKKDKHKQTDLDEELADVIITALMLSTTRTKNIAEEINKKLDKNLQKLGLK